MYELASSTWDDKEFKAMYRVIESDRFTMAQEVKSFEEAFAEKMKTKYAVMSNSGSSANLLAIAALFYSGRLKKGDEVIVTAVSWSTTYFPLCQYGLKLRFVDIDLDTLNIDVNQIEKAITKDTKAIFAVDILGNPNDYFTILQLCDTYKLLLIEDACEAMGGKILNKYLGTLGLLGTYSMYYSHHICSMEGGITVTDDEELYNYLLCLRSHGWTRHLPDDNIIYKKSPIKFYENFNFILPGYNLRPTEIQGAVAKEQLKKLDSFIEMRRLNADSFIRLASFIKDIKIQKEIGYSSWFGFSIVLQDDALRPLVIEELTKNNIETRPIVAGNFTLNPVIKYIDHTIYGDLTNSNIIHNNGFFIGNHSKDISKNVIDVSIKILEVLSKNGKRFENSNSW
jgi:CDP-6-deoxy-D-xylo-4-hexulose-3-dehydrase